MATIRYSSRQKKWIVVWKSQGMTFRQECSSEEEAKAFSDAQETISRKEREFLVKRRRRKALTVEELFEKHFLVCLKSPLTIEQNRHHSNILLSFFGKKEISRITKKDIFDFCSEQKTSGPRAGTGDKLGGGVMASPFPPPAPDHAGSLHPRTGKPAHMPMLGAAELATTKSGQRWQG